MSPKEHALSSEQQHHRLFPGAKASQDAYLGSSFND